MWASIRYTILGMENKNFLGEEVKKFYSSIPISRRNLEGCLFQPKTRVE